MKKELTPKEIIFCVSDTNSIENNIKMNIKNIMEYKQ